RWRASRDEDATKKGDGHATKADVGNAARRRDRDRGRLSQACSGDTGYWWIRQQHARPGPIRRHQRVQSPHSAGLLEVTGQQRRLALVSENQGTVRRVRPEQRVSCGIE